MLIGNYGSMRLDPGGRRSGSKMRLFGRDGRGWLKKRRTWRTWRRKKGSRDFGSRVSGFDGSFSECGMSRTVNLPAKAQWLSETRKWKKVPVPN